MISRNSFIVTVPLIAFLWLNVPVGAAAERVALVIGNGDYEHVASLRNPENDASAMARILKQLEFRVIHRTNLMSGELRRVLQEFAIALDGAEVGLFFYAGHGLQVGDRNYFAAADARLRTEADLLFETLHLDDVLDVMETQVPTRIVFLDACRDNPLTRSLARSMGTRSSAIGRGLASVRAGTGTLIAFATAPGEVAIDGQGENSPFTQGLLEYMATPGLDIAQMLRRVRKSVKEATDGQQVPWSTESLTGDFYFDHEAMSESTAGTPGSSNGVSNAEVVFWQSISDSEVCSDFESYLANFPDGRFAGLARTRRGRYCTTSEHESNEVATRTHIRALLKKCGAHFQSQRLTTDIADSALGCYREVLDLDPDNRAALDGIKQIENAYLRAAMAAIEWSDVQRAQSNLDTLRKLNPEHGRIQELEESIAALEDQPKPQAETKTGPSGAKNSKGRDIGENNCHGEIYDPIIVPGFEGDCWF